MSCLRQETTKAGTTMKKTFSIFVLLIVSSPALAAELPENPALREELLVMEARDQELRNAALAGELADGMASDAVMKADAVHTARMVRARRGFSCSTPMPIQSSSGARSRSWSHCLQAVESTSEITPTCGTGRMSRNATEHNYDAWKASCSRVKSNHRRVSMRAARRWA